MTDDPGKYVVKPGLTYEEASLVLTALSTLAVHTTRPETLAAIRKLRGKFGE